MEEFIARYGLFAVFLGATVEGDVTMILTGVAAHLGLLDPLAAIGTGACGALVSDCGFYVLGRRNMVRVRGSHTYLRAAPAIERLSNRLGTWEVVAARFVYGTRVASMLFWGLHGLPWHRFLPLAAAGCVAWACFLAGLGYFLSSQAVALAGRVHQVEIGLLAALLVAAGLIFGLRLLSRRLRR